MSIQRRSGLGQDLLPEYCRYRDEGCELAPSCLDCPFARCVYEESGGKRQRLKEIRNREMHRLFHGEDRKVREIAHRFGVSERTVQRAIRAIEGRREQRQDYGVI